jgi:small subunit ribosomal protein S6
MAAPEPLYDLVLLLDTSAPEDQRKKVLSDVESAISSSGTIVSDHDWGTRALAYEIRHRTDAEYHLLQFHGPATLLASLQRNLRIADGVLRFRIVKLAPGTPAPTELPRAEAPAAAPAPTAAPAQAEPAAEAEAEAEPAAPAAPADEPAESAETPSAA